MSIACRVADNCTIGIEILQVRLKHCIVTTQSHVLVLGLVDLTDLTVRKILFFSRAIPNLLVFKTADESKYCIIS